METPATTPLNPDSPIVIGKFGAAYGVRGWIKVHSFTDPLDAITAYLPWPLENSVTDYYYQGEQLIVKLAGIEDPETVRRYTNKLITISRAQLPPPPEGEYYWADLIGLRVFHCDGSLLGIVQRVDNFGASDLLILIDPATTEELFIPFISSVIEKVDLASRCITVNWEL